MLFYEGELSLSHFLTSIWFFGEDFEDILLLDLYEAEETFDLDKGEVKAEEFFRGVPRPSLLWLGLRELIIF